VVVRADPKFGPAPNREIHLVFVVWLLAVRGAGREDVNPGAEELASQDVAGVTTGRLPFRNGVLEVRRLERRHLFLHAAVTLMQLNRPIKP